MHEQDQSGEGSGLKEGVFAKARKSALPFFITMCLLATGAAAYFYSQTISLRKSNPQVVAQEDVQKLVAQVSKHIVLPVGELPTVAKITDPAALKSQPFFANAQVGDMLLVYEQARKAIIYSQSKDRIIEVGPVTPTPASDAKK